MNALLMALALTSAPLQEEAPGARVSKMMNLYFAARKLDATIDWVQAANDTQLKTSSRIVLDRDGRRVYINQVRDSGSTAGRWVVTADGNVMTYPTYQGAMGRDRVKRVREPMILKDSKGLVTQLTEKEVFVACGLSLADRDVPLYVLFGRVDDLAYLKGQLATLTKIREDELEGEKVTVLGGDWRDYAAATVNGRYELWLNEKNELRRFVRQQSTTIPLEFDANGGVKRFSEPIKIVNMWTMSAKLDQPVDEQLFKIIN